MEEKVRDTRAGGRVDRYSTGDKGVMYRRGERGNEDAAGIDDGCRCCWKWFVDSVAEEDIGMNMSGGIGLNQLVRNLFREIILYQSCDH